MSGTYLQSVPVSAGADLSSHQYKAVQIDGTLATNNSDALGILQNKPSASGRDATVGYSGRTRYVAGGAVTAGNRLAVQSGGWLTAVTTVQLGVATALGAVSSGGVGEAIVHFAGVRTQITSSHLV